MSKLTADKIRKCRKIIRKNEKFKKWMEERDDVKYIYSQILSASHWLDYKMWLVVDMDID